MGLAQMFGWNGVNDWVDPRRQTLLGLGAGIAGGGPDFGRALGAGLQMGAQGQQIDQNAIEKAKADALLQQQAEQQRAFLQKSFPDLVPAYDAFGADKLWGAIDERLNPQASSNTLLDNANTRSQLADQYGLTGSAKQQFVLTGELPGGNQTGRAGVGQPVSMRNKNNPSEIIAVQPMTVGPGQNLMTGEPLQNPEDWVFDPIGVAGDKTTAVEDAKVAAKARDMLPGVELATANTLKSIDVIREDSAGESDQFGNTFGVPNRNIPAFAGSVPRQNWISNFESAQAGAFLVARNALKGGGQITDYEGGKAEAAYSRMQSAVAKGDKQNFDLALGDFEQALKLGLAKLREVANDAYKAGSSNVTGGTYTVLGVE